MADVGRVFGARACWLKTQGRGRPRPASSTTQVTHTRALRTHDTLHQGAVRRALLVRREPRTSVTAADVLSTAFLCLLISSCVIHVRPDASKDYT